MTHAYTYQGGRRVALTISRDHFICRSDELTLHRHDFRPLHAISAHSWSVATTPEGLHADLQRAREFAPAYPAYVVVATRTPLFVTDRVFIRFRHALGSGDAREFGVRFDLTLIDALSSRDYLFRIPAESDSVDIVRQLTETHIDDVDVVDHDLNIRPNAQSAFASDPDVSQQWQLLSAAHHPLVRRCALLDCEGAWKANGYGDPEVVIGVVDCGCDLDDPNFGPGKFADWAVMLDGALMSSADFVTPGSDELMDPPRSHGTICATLAAASVNDYGGVGVAPNCSLLPVKWQDLGSATTFPQSLFSRVIEFLRSRVDVVSSSWTRGANAYWPPYICDLLRDAAVNGGRQGNGIVWLWAVGNRNIPIEHRSSIAVPVSVDGDGDALFVTESSTEFTNSFVGIPGVLHVGAVSSLGQRCHYSNYGAGLDLVAPSSNFHLYGRHEVAGIDALAPFGTGGLVSFGGTSAATPMAAGVAALVRSANPDLSSTEIASLLRRTADRDLDLSGYAPSGRPSDPDPSWDISPIPPFDRGDFVSIGHPDGRWSPWFGFGKVNARRAVEEAMRRRPARSSA